MVLYQKYRPTKFSEMTGNKGTIESLEIKIKDENRPHVYLFTGEKGCGKTTAARIMAKELGANELSIKEINGASSRGINEAREIITQMSYLPVEGDCSIFIIDECHKTTSEWQNSMLKPLEDTPDHVYFFLCTTDPQKLLPTIKSRCTEFNFKTLKEKEMLRLLKKISIKERLDLEDDVLYMIIDSSQGSPRNAIVNLDRIKNIKNKDDIEEILSSGTEENKDVISLCRALIYGKKDWNEIIEILESIKEIDEESIRYAVLGYMNSVLMKKKNFDAALCIEFFSEPFYNSKKAGLTLACFQTLFSK